MRRLAFVFAAAAVGAIAFAAPAWAHVTIEPSSAPKGSDAVLSFVVPNEETGTTTTQVVVQFPQDHPIADALVQPIAGWKSSVEMAKVTTPISTDTGTVNEAVKTVTWTAQNGAGTPEGGFQEFVVSVGLPDVDATLSFPTVQTYGNGKSVSWIEQTAPGAPEPESPAPTLKLTATSGNGGTAAAPATTSSSSNDDGTARTLAILALVLGVIAIIVAIIMGLRGGKKPAATT